MSRIVSVKEMRIKSNFIDGTSGISKQKHQLMIAVLKLLFFLFSFLSNEKDGKNRY